MAAEPKEQPMSLDEFVAHAAEVYARLEREGGSVVIGQGDMYFTVRQKRRRVRKHPRHLTADDPLWSIIGIADSGEPGNDVSSNKHKYIADAIASYKGLSSHGTPTPSSSEATTPATAREESPESSQPHE